MHHPCLDTIGRHAQRIRIKPPRPTTASKLYVKGPSSSIPPATGSRNRLALSHSTTAEARRQPWRPGQTVVEERSGNTGSGLLWSCAAKGYPAGGTMADSVLRSSAAS